MADIVKVPFTVVMATYWGDNPINLGHALESINANSVLPDELILVFDGPIKASARAVVENFSSKFVLKLIQLDKNSGLAVALNEGIRHCSNEWIVRADADDINLADRFHVLNQYMCKNLDLFGSFVEERDENGSSSGLRMVPTAHEEIVKFGARRNPFNHMTVCFRKELFDRAGGYPDIFLREDYALWASMISHGARCLNIPHALVLATAGDDMYRRRGGIKYALGEVALQRHLIKCGFKGRLAAVGHGIARASVFLLTNNARAIFYKRFLRS